MEYIEAKKIVMNCPHVNWDYMAYEYIMNIYWGCSHGCIYCYARSDYYDKIGNMGGDFDCIRVKRNALEIVRNDLQRKTKTGVVCFGGMSDPYNPVEKELKLTHNSLELLNAFGFGVALLTKSDLVTRDTDVLTDIKEHSPVNIGFSITCSNDEDCKKLEPSVATSTERFKAIEHLAKHGIAAGVFMDPIIPYITDTEENVREMVRKASCYGAKYMYISPQVTMAEGQREYFFKEAEKNYPGIPEIYTKKFGRYYYCRSPRSKKLWEAFADECQKQNLIYNMRRANQMIRAGYNISLFNERDL